ncbi:MAG TPA: Calx-beta domain-containing protein [Ramlibacter sp.]|nr:Calx-beta domain-containing protein [Ramlibacter sp.]
MAVSASDITKLYLAYFGRPPDFDGMVYYTSQSNLTLQQIAANFSASPESQALYGSTSLSGVIDAIYMNLFNRHAEPGGLLYWSTEIASGRISPAFAAYAILIGAQNADAVAVANKLQVATDWLAHLNTSEEITGYSGAAAAAVAHNFLATVDATTASLTTAEANLDAAISASIHANDPTPLAAIVSAPSIVEGADGTKQLAFVVSLNHASGSAVTLSYSTTTTGTATPGGDFEATAGSLTFQPGETTKVVNVTVFGDGTVEADETVVLQVTGTSISNSGATGTGTIVNDDSTPILTTGIDSIDVSTTAGPNTIKGVVDGGTPANSTFSVGDTIHGNGLTTVELVVSVGGTGSFAYIDNVAAVNVIAGAAALIKFNALEWTNVGAVNLAGGVSGATLHLTSLGDEVDLGIGSGVGGSISATYQDGEFAALWNSGKGGASFDAGAGNVAVHLNTDGNSGGAFFSSTADLNVGDVVIDGGADSASAFFGASAGADLTVGGVSEAVGDSSSADVFLFASGDLAAGSIGQAVGDSGSAFVTVSATGDMVVGGIAQIVGASGFADVTANGSGDMTFGDISQQVGSGSSATALVDIYGAGGNISIGNVMQGAGNYVSLSVSTTGTGTINVGDVTQGASSSSAYIGINTDLGSIAVGDVNQTVGDSSTASVSINVRSFASGTSDVAGISVGMISQVGGDGANEFVVLAGAGGSTTTTAGTTIYGGALTVGGVSQVVGDSGYMSASFTSTFGAAITVGDISQSGGDSASAWAYVSGSSDINVGNVTQAIGDGVSQTARFQAYGAGDVGVGNIDVSVGNGSNLNAWVTISNPAGHDLTIGDVTVGAGDLTNATGTRPYAFFGAYNDSASGDLTVGDVAMNLGLTATGSITVSQTAAASMDGGNVTVGDINLSLADKAIVDNVFIYNHAAVFTSTSHTTLNSLGDLTVGDINVAMGTNASASITITESISGTGGDMGTLSVGDINVTADVNAYAWVGVQAGNYVGGDIAGVEIGNVNFDMDDGSSFTLNVTVSDTSGSLDHFTMGNASVVLGVSGSMNEFTVDVGAGSIGDVSIGDIDVTLGEFAFASTMSISISASTGDIGTVSIGDIHTVVGQSASYDDNSIDIFAAGDIGSVDIGQIHVEVGKNGSFTTNFITVSASGDIGSVSMGGLLETLAQSASGDGMYLEVYGNAIGSVDLGDVTVNIGKNASMSDLLYFSVTGTDIGTVSMGNEVVNIAAGGQRSSFDTAFISSTGDVGSVTFGNVAYHLNGASASTNNGIDRTVSASGDIGSVTAGNLLMTAVTGAMFTSGYHMNVNAGGALGDVTVGDVTLQGTSASDSMTASYDITAVSGIDSVTFGDLNASMVGAVTNWAWITVDVNGGTGDVGDVTVGDVTAMGASSGSGYVTVNVSGANIGDVLFGDLAATGNVGSGYAFIGANITAASAIGDVTVGDINLNLGAGTTTGAGSATVSLNFGAATASGDLTIGNIDMAFTASSSSTGTGAFGHVAVNFDALTGDVSVGMVSFDATTAATLSVDLEVTGAASVHLGGISVDNSGSFNGGDYVLVVNAGGADVTIDTIKVSGAGSSDLTAIMAGVATTGTITLGTVDYSGYTAGGAVIDVSAKNGDIHVIGSAGGDTITSNAQSDTLTGGNGTDTFTITDQAQDLATLTTFHTADIVTITDFKAGPTFAETITVDAEHTDVAHYAEKSAATADAAFTLALATMSDPTQQSDVVAVQVGGDVYVFIDQDGDNTNVDTIVKLTGVNTSALNFADFVVN